jgi:hypothetical protein
VGRIISTTLYRCNLAGDHLEDISQYLVAGFVEMNLDRDQGKLSATFTLSDPSKVRPYQDYLKPFLTIEYDDGRATITKPLGFYATRTPPSERTVERHDAQYSCEDLTRLLAQSAYTAVDNVPASTNIVTEITSTLDEIGCSFRLFPSTSATTTAAKSFSMGTTRLEKINDLLGSIGWYSIHPRADGRLTSRQYSSTSGRQPIATLTDDDLLEPIQMQINDESLANVIIVIKDNPTEAPLTAYRENTDPSSPTSTVNIGFKYARVERRSDLQTQAEVDALADRLLSESRSYYQTASLRIWPDYELGLHDVVELDLTGEMAELSGLWWVRTWAIGLTPSECSYQIAINRITNSLTGAVL